MVVRLLALLAITDRHDDVVVVRQRKQCAADDVNFMPQQSKTTQQHRPQYLHRITTPPLLHTHDYRIKYAQGNCVVVEAEAMCVCVCARV